VIRILIWYCSFKRRGVVDKIKGMSYGEIAEKGGGILNSAKKLNEMKEDELFDLAWKRLNEVIELGTGAIEIKSGYGLSVEGELKMLRVIKRLKNFTDSGQSDISWCTCLSLEFKEDRQGYIDLIINGNAAGDSKRKTGRLY